MACQGPGRRGPQGPRHRRLAGAFNQPDRAAGLARARAIAAELEADHPDAAASLREGLADMFTVRRLGVDGRLARTLTTTNAIESMISVAAPRWATSSAGAMGG